MAFPKGTKQQEKLHEPAVTNIFSDNMDFAKVQRNNQMLGRASKQLIWVNVEVVETRFLKKWLHFKLEGETIYRTEKDHQTGGG